MDYHLEKCVGVILFSVISYFTFKWLKKIKENWQKGLTQLHLACIHGDESRVMKLLQSGNVDVDKASTDGVTALMFAASNGRTAIVKHLLENKASLSLKDKQEYTAIDIASMYGHKSVVTILVHENVLPEMASEALWSVAYTDYVEIAEKLLAKGASVNFVRIEKTTPLFISSQEGQIGMLKLLIKHGADVNSKRIDGVPALIMASRKNQTEAVQVLIENKADINSQDNEGDTALSTACEFGFVNLARMLLSKGSSVDHTNKNGETPLFIATDQRDSNLVGMLLDAGADVDKRCGVSVLRRACLTHDVDTVYQILRQGPQDLKEVDLCERIASLNPDVHRVFELYYNECLY